MKRENVFLNMTYKEKMKFSYAQSKFISKGGGILGIPGVWTDNETNIYLKFEDGILIEE